MGNNLLLKYGLKCSSLMICIVLGRRLCLMIIFYPIRCPLFRGGTFWTTVGILRVRGIFEKGYGIKMDRRIYYRSDGLGSFCDVCPSLIGRTMRGDASFRLPSNFGGFSQVKLFIFSHFIFWVFFWCTILSDFLFFFGEFSQSFSCFSNLFSLKAGFVEFFFQKFLLWECVE